MLFLLLFQLFVRFPNIGTNFSALFNSYPALSITYEKPLLKVIAISMKVINTVNIALQDAMSKLDLIFIFNFSAVKIS